MTTLKDIQREGREEFIQSHTGPLGYIIGMGNSNEFIDELIEKAFRAGIEAAKAVRPDDTDLDGTYSLDWNAALAQWDQNIAALLTDNGQAS